MFTTGSAAVFLAVAAPAQATDSRFDVSVEMRATWYGPGYEGRHTASGEVFNPHALTAAHPSLPLGASVRVRASDGRSVVVRINDRSRADTLDLTPAAARSLRLIDQGSDTVEVAMPAEVAERWVDGED